MSHRFKILLLITILFGKTSSYATQEIPRLSAESRFFQVASRLLKNAKYPPTLFLVTGYLRLFAPLHFLVEIKKMICQYAGAVSESPYAGLKFKTSDPDAISKIYRRKMNLISLSKNKYAAIHEEKLIFLIKDTNGVKRLITHNRFLMKNTHQDALDYLFPLEDQSPHFSFLVVTKGGCVSYISGTHEKDQPKPPVRLYGFSVPKIDQVGSKISFYPLKKSLTFAVLLNTVDPFLSICKIFRQKDGANKIKRFNFNTSKWHKNCHHYLRNLHLLNNHHFLFLSHDSHEDARVFLYNLYITEPVGYISLDKKYTLVSKFSYDHFCVFSQLEPGILLFSHKKQKFIHVPGRKDLHPIMFLRGTRQLIMVELPHSQQKRLQNYKEGRLLLCTLSRTHRPVIEQRFQVVLAEDQIKEGDRIHYEQLSDNLFLFGIEKYQVSEPHVYRLLCKEKLFTLAKKKIGLNNL